jgi:hypothetical protein
MQQAFSGSEASGSPHTWAAPSNSSSSANSSPRVGPGGAGPSVSGGGYLPSNLGRTASNTSAAAVGNGKASAGGAPPRLSSVASSAFSDVSDVQLSRLASSLQASSSIAASQGEELLLQHLRSGDPALLAALAAGPPGLGGSRRSIDSSGAFDLQLAAMSRSVSSSSGGMVHVQVTTSGPGPKGGVISEKGVNRNASLLDLANATMAAASAAHTGLPTVRRRGLPAAACMRGRRAAASAAAVHPGCTSPADLPCPAPLLPPQGATTEEIQRRLQTLELLAAASGQDGQRPINQLFQMPTIVSGLQSSQGGADPAATQQPAASPTPAPTEVQAN